MKAFCYGFAWVIALFSLSIIVASPSVAQDTTSGDILNGIIPGGRCACPYVRRECHDLSDPADRARFVQICRSGAGACTDQTTCTMHLTKDLCDSLSWLPEWNPGRQIPAEPITEPFCLLGSKWGRSPFFTPFRNKTLCSLDNRVWHGKDES